MTFRLGRNSAGVRWTLATALLTLLAAAPASAAQTRFYFNDPGGRNIVEFRSKAPLETIVGRTSAITGHVSVDPTDISQISGRVVIDLASFDTGIDTRNGHMRERFLHTDEYPEAVFVINEAKPKGAKTLENGKSVDVEVLGDLTLHGVTKPVTALATVSYLEETEQTKARIPGNLINVDAEFHVNLSDFDIERPKMLILKVADEVGIKVEAVATTTEPKQEMNP